MAIPLVAGLGIRAWLPELAQMGLEYLPRVALMALLVHVTLYILASLPEFSLLSGAGAVAFAVAFAVIGIVIGYVIGPRGVPIEALGSSRRSRLLNGTRAWAL